MEAVVEVVIFFLLFWTFLSAKSFVSLKIDVNKIKTKNCRVQNVLIQHAHCAYTGDKIDVINAFPEVKNQHAHCA